MKFVTRSDLNLKSVKETKSLISYVCHCHLEIRKHKVMGKSKKEKTICRYGKHAILETKSYMVPQDILPFRNFSKTSPYPYEISIQVQLVLSGPQWSQVVRGGPIQWPNRSNSALLRTLRYHIDLFIGPESDHCLPLSLTK